jgi:hypothetical protein
MKNRSIKKLILPLIAFTAAHAHATSLWVDNFDTGDTTNFDAASTAGRLSGTAAGETALQSFGSQQDINANRLDLDAVGGVRFGGETARYNWGGATTGADILAGGGFIVTFDWTHDGSTSEWLAWKVGTDNGDSGVNAGGVDYSLLIRQGANGLGDTNERWDNGSNLGYSGTSYNPILGLTTYPVSLTYSFSSFADGSNVNIVANVNGIEIDNSNFTWDGNGGEIRMELQSGIDGNFIDNLSIASIPVPEPSTTAFIGLVGCLAFTRRRPR